MSRPVRRVIPRDCVGGNKRLIHDYVSENPVNPEHIFRRRFWMTKELFIRIVAGLGNHLVYFRQQYDTTELQGLLPIQKCTAALRQLAYGGPADMFDEYIRIGESTSVECLKNFCRGICEVFSPQYLRRLTREDVQHLHDMHLQCHGYLGMLGSVDCMHWEWKNCPVAWKGQFTRGHGKPTIVLEAIVNTDLWIWHAYFGVAGSNNNINVLNQSPLFNDVLQGTTPAIEYIVNSNTYTIGYYLADGIYPEWAVFVKSFSFPEDSKRSLFKQTQESARKDVEQAFGVLQARWAIVRCPSRSWYKTTISNIMYACVIMHNMIVEHEGHTVTNWSGEDGDIPTDATLGSYTNFQRYLQQFANLHNNDTHHCLRLDLVEHI